MSYLRPGGAIQNNEVKVRWSTRLSKFFRKLTRRHPTRAIPIRTRQLAGELGLSYEHLVRLLGDMANCGRRTAWTFQAYGFVIFLRYRPSSRKCGHPQFYVVNRYALHRVGPRAFNRLRKAKRKSWSDYFAHFKKLAHGLMIRGRERANDNHKGSPYREAGGIRAARPPPTANRGGLRRFDKVAGQVALEFGRKSRYEVSLHGWLLNRCAEGHSAERILDCLMHAHDVLARKEDQRKSWLPKNIPAWICAVAHHHLDADGLGIVQRFREIPERQKRHGAVAPTWKEKGQRRPPGEPEARPPKPLGNAVWLENAQDWYILD
jgi:hypothetical protein